MEDDVDGEKDAESLEGRNDGVSGFSEFLPANPWFLGVGRVRDGEEKDESLPCKSISVARSSRRWILLTVFLRKPIELCCSARFSWSLLIEDKRNWMLSTSVLPDGSLLGSAARNCVKHCPPFSKSTTSQILSMSFTTFCLKSSAVLVQMRLFLDSSIPSEISIFLHSLINNSWAVESSSNV